MNINFEFVCKLSVEADRKAVDVEVDFNNVFKKYYLKEDETIMLKNLKLASSGLFQISARVPNCGISVNPLIKSK